MRRNFSLVTALLLVISFLATKFITPTNAADNHIMSDAELREMSSLRSPETEWQKSDWWLSGYFSPADKRELKDVQDEPLDILVGAPRCPSSWTWYYGNTDKYKRKWQKRQRQKLQGFPEKIINYCAKPAFISKKGKLTNHSMNDRYVSRQVATVVIKDKQSNETAAMRAIQENDYMSKKTGGKVFNENLEEVCKFKFAGDDVIVKCKNFGIFPAKMKITSIFKGAFKIFGQNEEYAFFITNLNLEKTKKDYPEFFKDKKKCIYNCG